MTASTSSGAEQTRVGYGRVAHVRSTVEVEIHELGALRNPVVRGTAGLTQAPAGSVEGAEGA